MYPNDTLSREGCLKFLSRSGPAFTSAANGSGVGAVSVTICQRANRSIVGRGQDQVGRMVSNAVSSRYTARTIFIQAAENNSVTAVTGKHRRGSCLVPERALLEMLSEWGCTRESKRAPTLWRGRCCDQSVDHAAPRTASASKSRGFLCAGPGN